MTDALDDNRDSKWPTVEDATRRITVLIEGQVEGITADMAARDLIVLMRELGRVTAVLEAERETKRDVSDVAAHLAHENRRLREALLWVKPRIVERYLTKGEAREMLGKIDAALAEPASGEANTPPANAGRGGGE